MRLQLKAIHFDEYEVDESKIRVAYDSTDEESQHLSKLMRSTNQSNNLVGLDLTYTYERYERKQLSPMKLRKKICYEIGKGKGKISLTTNTFLLVNDDGRYNANLGDIGIFYFMYLAAIVKVPVLTWFPDRIGQLKTSDHNMILRLEPTNWHVARAIADFLQAYNWTTIGLVVSDLLPDRRNIIKELLEIQKEMSNPDHPSYFKFEIRKANYFHGNSFDNIRECTKTSNILCPTMKSLAAILDKIWRQNIRIIVFHGNKADFTIMLTLVRKYAVGPRRQMMKLFGEGYLWICTPAFSSPIKTSKRNKYVHPDNINFVDRFPKTVKLVSGMFFLSSLNNYDSYKKMAKFSRLLWQNSMVKLLEHLQRTNHNNSTAIEEALLPKDCEWEIGNKLYKIMKSNSVIFEKEYVGFTHTGLINTTEMFIFNSKAQERGMKWSKVGIWSMSSKWGKKKSNLQIDGVTWPGNMNKPPKGRPDKFLVRVATIKEMPFVFYGKVQENGKCDANAIKCTVRRDSVDYTESESLMMKNVTSLNNKNDDNVKNASLDNQYQYACCAGLTIDLLHELMKDLNFDVDLFEVPDGKWGGWTPEGWNGLVKVLKDKKAEMVMTSFKITTNRSGQIDFSVPFMETGIAIIVALKKGAISPKAFLEPYDYSSWCVILVFSVHACGAALFIYEWVSPNGLDRGAVTSTEHKFSLFRSLWLIWSMLFGAAVNTDNPRGVASRFVANIWALFALVFLASYTANLAAFMIAKDDYYDIKGIRDWRLLYPKSHKPTFRFATVPSGATEENIKVNFPDMYRFMKNFNRSTIDDGIKALKTGDIDAFVYDSNVLDYKAARDKKCKLKTVGNLFAMTGYGVGFPMGSHWREKINKLILGYQRHGKLQRWKRFWMTGQCKKERKLDSTNKTLGVTNFISAFILLLGGMLLSCLLLCLEHIFYRFIRPHVRNFDTYECCGLVSLSMGQLISVNQAVDVITHHGCSDNKCKINQWKVKEENIVLKRKVQTLETQIEYLTKRAQYYNSNIHKSSNQIPVISNYNNPISQNSLDPSTFSTSFATPPNHDYSDNPIYVCNKSNSNKVHPNISARPTQYCPLHIPHDPNILPKLCQPQTEPSYSIKSNFKRPKSYVESNQTPELNTPVPVQKYKIIKTKLPNNFAKISNSIQEAPTNFASSILKMRKRKNENIVKESCL